MPYDGSKSDNKPVLPQNWRGSTHLNSTIKSYEDLAYRIKIQFGYPVNDLEVTDEQIAIFIDEAIEWYTQYSGLERKYLVFCDDLYVPGCGVKLDDIVRNIDMKSECSLSSSTVEVLSTELEYTPISDNDGNILISAYVSASPFLFPDLNDKTLSAIGQDLILKFDKRNPWDTTKICKASCFTIYPKGSNCNSLSSSSLEVIDFTDLILEYPELSGLIENPTISSSDTGIIEISSLDCSILSSIPISYYPISSFYPEAELIGFPVNACISIRNGQGVIKPVCDINEVKCSDLTSTWEISNDFDTEVIGETISGEDGRVLPFSAFNMKLANSVSIPGLPICSIDGTLSLNENTGKYATFFVCNSAIDTNGDWVVDNVQFLKSYLPPSNIFETRYCDIKNKGFVITKTLTSSDDCIQNTSDWIPVDVVFDRTSVNEITGTVTTVCSGGYDYELNYRRRINSVFSMDYTSGNGGYFGSNLLFSFDYGMVANAFGYDLQGNRNLYRNGYDMLSYEMARGFIDQVQRMVNYASYEFNPDTQYLTIIPEPFPEQSKALKSNRCYVVGIYLEKPLSHIINKKWVQEWARARTMETLGYIRSKYGNVTLFGGASLQGDSLVTMANTEKERLLKELRDDHYYTETPMFFIG